jgi:hypothetical protein
MAYRNRARDPYWLTAKFNSVCGKPGCNQPIKRGERAFYYPNTKTILADSCGHAGAASADFESHAFDDDNNGSM